MCPQQRYTTGEPGKIHGRKRVGIVEESSGYQARGVSIRGKFVLSRNPRYKTGGGRQMAKHSSDPRVAYPEVKVQARDPVRVVGIVAPFAPRRVNIRGKFVLSRNPEYKTRVIARGLNVVLTPRYLWVLLPPLPRRGQYSGKFVLSRNPGYKTRGVAMWLNVVQNPGYPIQKSKYRYGT